VAALELLPVMVGVPAAPEPAPAPLPGAPVPSATAPPTAPERTR